MDALIVIGQLTCIAGLAYGAWLCFVHAGRYDAESLHADEAASRDAHVRGHAEVIYPPLDIAA
jgi:hypothetical protein